jgi:predicted RNase H-like HicB family nuclease
VSRRAKLIQSVFDNPKDVRFADACKVAELIGFTGFDRSGSHNGYARPGEIEQLDFQDRGGKIKPYQAKQALQDDRKILGLREGSAKMSENLRYSTQIFFSEEDGGFIALAPDLPGCTAFGETAEEALHELQDAIRAWIGAAKKAGNPVPPPAPHRAEELPSGKVLARFPKTLHAQLIERAARDNTSLNTCLVMLVAKGLIERPRIDHAIQTVWQGSVGISSSVVIGTPTRFLKSWIEAHVGEHYPALPVKSSRTTSLVEKIDEVVSGGSALNLYMLPVGKPVIFAEDDNG